jgi:RNA polymerase sigma factor (sigma-70 family)
MDVQGAHSQVNGASAASRPPSRARVGQALGEWQTSELRHMWRHPHCRGLSLAQLEDLYQETVLALLNRRFFNEEHLRNALRYGLCKRALHVHRDERRRSEILIEHAPEAHRIAMRRGEIDGPEQAALAREDGQIVLEFVAELTPLERQVYALEAEGLRYRAIAPIVRVEVNAARRASRSVQSKRKRFQLLHDTGRLCGYRAPTIRALIAGEATSEALALAAFAHLEACASCRAEHRTNARRLRLSFQQRAAALLPLPALSGHLGLLARADVRLRTIIGRWLPQTAASPGGGVRERVIAVAAGSGVAAKLAAGAATVAIIAGGTLGVDHPTAHRHQGARHRARLTASTRSAAVRHTARAYTPTASTRARAASDRASAQQSPRPREPGGFAFLGVPSGHSATSARARAASTSGAQSGQPVGEGAAAKSGGGEANTPQTGGGPFSP